VRKISESKSWKELNNHLASLTTSQKSKEGGDIFEHVCKYYLQTAPHYQSKLKKVWLLKEIKEDLKRKLNLPDTDEGIDLIAETYDKEYWAIQSKYRSNPKDTLTIKGDLATFANLAFNNCKHISHGLVLTTSDKPPLKTKLLRGVGFETLESFVGLDDNNCEGWKAITAKAKGKIIKPKALTPRPHQAEAIKKSFEHFKNNERGKMIMPCGTGKSLAAFWIARKVNAKSILIAVPSLALLQQTLKVWTREYLIAGVRPDWLCVCSDQTVSDDQDDFVSNIYDLGIDVTTDKADIKKFLKKKNSNLKIVFTTYQSGKVTAQGAKGFKFDLGIMDEAHKTVGHGEKAMAHLIHQKNIKIKNRLFMTATERLFRGDKDEYLSMDDPRDYGEIIYQLSFKAAIEMKPPIISDYKIITFGITAPEIEAVYSSNKFIQVKKEIDNITAREFATAIALRKAIKKLKISNAISFHSSIKRANNFKKQQELISKVYKDYGTLKSFHVSGAMATSQRASQMREFAEGKGLMTNARCLTEGVDLPAIDCVVFTDPKRSKVDIVQAAGRALRLSPGKKFGYILIPILISEDENATEAAKDTAFEDIVATIRALATQDTRIVDYLRAVSSGTIPRGKGSPVDGLTKLNVLTKVNEEDFNKSIQLKVWDRVAFGNWRSYEEAKEYIRKKNIRSISGWIKFTKKNNFPPDIPKAPDYTYKNKGWKNWGVFLNSGFIATNLRKYLPYSRAKKIIEKTKILTANKYLKFTKSKSFPKNLPTVPDKVYLNAGWKSWYDFLPYKKNLNSLTNTRLINYYNDQNNFLKYDVAKKFIKKNKIKSKTQFKKNYIGKKFFLKVPNNPEKYYEKNWSGWFDFLESNTALVGKQIKYKSFNEAKKYMKKFNFNTWGDWQKFAKSNLRPFDIPARPSVIYKDQWISLHDFLGSKYIPRSARSYLEYNKAKKFIKKFNFKKSDDFYNFIKSKKFPEKILPRYPGEVYKNKGWLGWGNFLGTGAIWKKNFISYNEAKKQVISKNIISKNDYSSKRKKLNLKNILPSAPQRTYKKEWKGWDDFLGKKK